MPSSPVGRVPVVFVIDNMRFGGTELNAVRTAALLDRERYDLRVVCLSGDGPLSERYRAMGIPIETLPMKSLYGTSMLVSGYRFVRYLRRERVQIVHAHDMYTNVFVMPWARLARTRVVIASRRWWHSLPNSKLRYANIAAFRAADAVLANSPQVARSVEEADGVRPERIHVISNFVDDDAFAPLPAAERHAQLAAWGIPEGAIVVGCVARLVSVKDHATLLRAFGAVKVRVPHAHLLLIGDGDTRSALESEAQALGIASSVTFAGELRSGQNHHRLFDLSVLCSLSEGFPNSLVEAMAAGVPIVATRVGGNVDAVVDGENGLLVEVGDAEGMSRAIGGLLEDGALRHAMGAAGRARAHERYRAAAAIASLDSMYQRLLSGNAK